ncbi:MAG: ABC transporter substrate-binding protein [Rhodocyclaceae bacterium]|nr:ABC transporter substrate-binding protein [Rhodocyclaceae bacterium]
MTRSLRGIAAALITAGLMATAPVSAQDNTQFVPIVGYRLGPLASIGQTFYAGMVDYFNLINERDGGINGVKLSWEECETEYNNSKGVECYERLKGKSKYATAIQPMSSGITYSLVDRIAVDKIPLVTIGYGRTDPSDGRVFPYVFPMITNYWSMTTDIVKFIGMKEGGMDKLAGKKIGYVFHDSAFGKEAIPILQDMAARYGFQVDLIPVAPPGLEQQSQWLQVRQNKPDYVILWTAGVMNPSAISGAAKVGSPREKMIGITWAASEEDTIGPGAASKGYIAANYTGVGANFPVVQAIVDRLYKKDKGNLANKALVGATYHNRGIVAGLITVEAVRKAQEKYGKKPLTGEQVRWGFENLDLDEKRLKSLGAEGFMPPLKITCADHEGSGMLKFQQWDGAKWVSISDWIEPERARVRAKIEASSTAYAKEKGITLRDCSKEG